MPHSELPSNINTRQSESFLLTDEGEVARRVEVDGAVEGSFSPSGLNTAIRTTTMDVGTTAIPLPATALTGRNSLEIQNRDATEILYIGNADVTADSTTGTTSGKEVDPGSFWSIDVTEDIVLYGRVASGTIQIKITEVA